MSTDFFEELTLGAFSKNSFVSSGSRPTVTGIATGWNGPRLPDGIKQPWGLGPKLNW